MAVDALKSDSMVNYNSISGQVEISDIYDLSAVDREHIGTARRVVVDARVTVGLSGRGYRAVASEAGVERTAFDTLEEIALPEHRRLGRRPDRRHRFFKRLQRRLGAGLADYGVADVRAAVAELLWRDVERHLLRNLAAGEREVDRAAGELKVDRYQRARVVAVHEESRREADVRLACKRNCRRILDIFRGNDDKFARLNRGLAEIEYRRQQNFRLEYIFRRAVTGLLLGLVPLRVDDDVDCLALERRVRDVRVKVVVNHSVAVAYRDGAEVGLVVEVQYKRALHIAHRLGIGAESDIVKRNIFAAVGLIRPFALDRVDRIARDSHSWEIGRVV